MVAEAPAQRYQLESQLGGGRTGEVWQARDTQSNATVAYKKVVRASLATPAAAERAQRELKQLQRAQSPRIARVLDFGKASDGTLFVVTELVEGRPLQHVIAESGPFPLDRTKKIVAQIGDALLEGQKVGVVHHDLAAKNILIDERDEVKVINFVAPLPVSETVFGVPEFLSPEQAEGKLVDQRSNTYSLGALMTLMLTGQPPFSGGDAASVVEQVLRGEIVPPSRRVDGLTPEIDRVVLKAMDKSPNRRPLTMRQFLTDVSSLVALGAAPAADASKAGVGFAKTIMFGAGSPEAQRLADEAMAARASANGHGTGAPAAAAAPPAAEPAGPSTPPPQPGAAGAGAPIGPRRTHGAAIAATMVALPAARIPGAASHQATQGPVPNPVNLEPPQETPPPNLNPAVAQAAPSAAPRQAAGGNFRETLWFKKGDVDQMVADARARVQAGKAPRPATGEQPEVAVEDGKPLEERYVDDGSVTVEDRKKFSLRSGGTATGLPTVGSVPGERMSDAEIASEIGGGKRMTIIVAAVVVVLAIIAVVAVAFRGKNVSKSASALSPENVPTAAAPAAPAPTPPPPTAAPSAPAPAAAPAAAAKAETGSSPSAATAEAAPPAPRPHASGHKKASKKPTKGKKSPHKI
jgi:hypothetical protein